MDTDLVRYHLLLLLEALRGQDGEGQFGHEAPSLDPVIAFAKSSKSPSLLGNVKKLSHPILSRTTYFSGIDSRLTPDPVVHEADADSDPRLNLSKRHKLSPKPTGVVPRLTRQ